MLTIQNIIKCKVYGFIAAESILENTHRVREGARDLAAACVSR